VSAPVDIANVRATLGGREILRAIDLRVAAGEWVNIIGPNGAGKTTLLRACIGAIDYSGSITIGGVTHRRTAERARTLAYVAQSATIPPGIGVVDYVLLGRTPHRGMFAADSRADRALVAQILDRLDLRSFAGRDVRSLSGGERQRVILARALAQQTPVLLLDEPTTALDLGHQQEVLDLVEEIRREEGLTVLATLHDLTLAARYGDRVALLSDGRVEKLGDPAEVLTDHTIAEYFDARVRVIDDPEGPIIVPTTAAHGGRGR